MDQKPVFYTFLLLIAVVCSFCHTDSEPFDRPNIIWLTSEDNSKHYLSLFDNAGVQTPNIARLAQHGLRFSRAFSNAPVCSVARSTLISGCYAPRIGVQFHRKLEMVSMPDSLEMFPAYLRQAGYYTSNNRKEDYNIIKSDMVWDESSASATWKNRKGDQPFFHVQNFTLTHESSLHFSTRQMDTTSTVTDPDSVFVLPVHPTTDLFRFTNAYYRDKIVQMDAQVGEFINDLEQEGLLENTFVFYFGDHGGVLPGSKGYLYETGLHIPLVVHIPEQYWHLIDAEPGSTIDGFVSFVDFAPTVLNLAAVDVPEGMDGTPFLGTGVTLSELSARDEVYGYADRFDEKYDLVRSVRKGNYKYIRSFQPINFDGLMNNYRYIQLAYQEWWNLYKSDALNEKQSHFFKARPVELLFDLTKDPYETNNLAGNATYQDKLFELRNKLNEWMTGLPDLSLYPEHYLLKHAWPNPVAFGRTRQDEINAYLETANLALAPFADVKELLAERLNSTDPWERYWALIVSTSFGQEASSLAEDILQLMQSDDELINKVRAAECLTTVKIGNYDQAVLDALYHCNDSAEALLILNTIVLLQDGYGIDFDLHVENLSKGVRENSEVQRRLTYLIGS